MKNSKTIIIVTVIAALILAGVVGFIAYKIASKPNNNTDSKQIKTNSSDVKNSDSFKAVNYTLRYGTYKGYSVEYVWDDEKGEMVESKKNEITVKLNSDNTYELGEAKAKFVVSGTNLIVPELNNTVMFEAIGDNKIILQAGSGVELTYIN